MCGIVGWFDGDAEAAPQKQLTKAMADAIRHRGPDGEGFHFELGLAFGHRRLAIIDLSTGDQPMATEGGRVVIVFNGEIYNYRALRTKLEGKGHSFRTKSDTEVILRGWLEWGAGCVEHLKGMFAFALWDRQDKTLFLARDRLGEKPLYYSVLPDNGIIFASELKGLTATGQISGKIDPQAVEDYFSLGYVADPKTIYQDARKLPAGYTLTLRRGSPPTLNQYWDPKPAPNGQETANSAAPSLLARLGASVQSQLISDVPLGSFLSGGVDSSAITALAAGRVKGPLNAFTIGFNNPKFDERTYADQVARQYGLSHFTDVMRGDETDDIAQLPAMFDEPFGDSSALPNYRLTNLASKHVKVALSGDGGDELFAGYRRYLFHGREEAFRRVVPPGLRRPLFGFLGSIYPQLDWAPKALRARQTFRELSCNAAEGFFHNVQITDEITRDRLFNANLKKEISGYRGSDTISEHMEKAPFEDAVSIAQYVDLKTWLVGDILTKVDRTAMACGLEVRVPMLAPDFVEWSLGLPRELKLSGGKSKIVLKRALEPLLSEEILYRRKQGFSVPLANWFRGSLGTSFSREIGEGAPALAEFFDIAHIDQLLRSHRGGWADHSRILWLLWMFSGFLKHSRAALMQPTVQLERTALASNV